MTDILDAKVVDAVFILIACVMDMTTVEMAVMKKTVVGDNSQKINVIRFMKSNYSKSHTMPSQAFNLKQC